MSGGLSRLDELRNLYKAFIFFANNAKALIGGDSIPMIQMIIYFGTGIMANIIRMYFCMCVWDRVYIEFNSNAISRYLDGDSDIESMFIFGKNYITQYIKLFLRILLWPIFVPMIMGKHWELYINNK